MKDTKCRNCKAMPLRVQPKQWLNEIDARALQIDRLR